MNIKRKDWNGKTTLAELIEGGCTVEELFSLMVSDEVKTTSPATEPSEKKPLVVRISDILQEIGIPAHIKGYQYIRCAINLAYENMDLMEAVTKKLYPTVAKKFDTTPSRVERSIRHAIEVAWDRGDIEVLQQYFGNTICGLKGKPTNSEFIGKIADILHMQDEMDQ